MNLLSPSDQTESSQFLLSPTQLIKQTSLTHRLSQVNGLPANPFPLLVVGAYLAAVFFCIGMLVGKQSQTRRKRKALRKAQIQTLERVWKSTHQQKH